MRLPFFLPILAALIPGSALACSAIQDDAERLACFDATYAEVRMIRCTDMFGTANCEVTSPSPMGLVSCTAFDAAGAVIARASGFGASGVLFPDLSASAIASLDCEPSG